MSSASAEDQAVRETAIFGQKPVVLAAWAAAGAVALLFSFFLVRYSNDTQKELRLIPWLEYSRRVDFGYFYAATQMVWHGQASDLYPKRGEPVFYEGDPVIDRTPNDYLKARLLARGNYYNPPGLALIEAPLAALSFRDAFWLFSVVSFGALGAFLFLLWRAGSHVTEMPLFLFGVVAFRPVHEAFIMGHPSLLFALVLGGGFLALRGGRPVLAGLVLSALALKPQWAVLPALFLLVRGQWRALAAMAGASVLIFVLPFFVTGFGSLKTYVQFIQDASSIDVKDAPHMFSWNGFLYKLTDAPANTTLLYALIAVTIVPILVAWRSRDLYLGVAATIMGMLLISTHSVWYDWSFLIVAGGFLVLRPSSLFVRVQTWVVLLALYLAAGQSVGALIYPGHHYTAWERKAFYVITPLAFAALVWVALVPYIERWWPARLSLSGSEPAPALASTVRK